MTKTEIKELKEMYSNMTLGELKGRYSEAERISICHKESIREKATELANLDFNHKYYTDKAKNLMNDISFYKSHIKNDAEYLKLMKPILDKKILEGINQEEYEKYVKANADIRVLIKAIEDDKAEFIASGSKILIPTRYETKEIVLTKKEVNDMYYTMLTELIFILKDRIGNITKVEYLSSNGNRGMDGLFTGEKGKVEINTILAYGEVQRPHYRTLVYDRRF